MDDTEQEKPLIPEVIPDDDDLEDEEDIDTSIIYYFNNIIRPTVFQAGENIKVPIIYATPERWSSVQKDGFYRDKDQKLLVPLILFPNFNSYLLFSLNLTSYTSSFALWRNKDKDFFHFDHLPFRGFT